MKTIQNWSIYTVDSLQKMKKEIEIELSYREVIVEESAHFILWEDAVKTTLPELKKDGLKAFLRVSKACVNQLFDDDNLQITIEHVAELKYQHVKGIRNVGHIFINRMNKVLKAYNFSPIPYGKDVEKQYQIDRRKGVH